MKRMGVHARRMEMIEKVSAAIHIERVCRREAWALREAGGDVSMPVQEAKLRMFDKWPKAFDELDDATLLSAMEGWATVVTQKVLHEIKRETLRGGVTHAPDGFSARPFAEVFPDQPQPDLYDTAMMGIFRIEPRDAARAALARQIDPLGQPEEILERSHRVLMRIHAEFRRRGRPDDFFRLLKACEKRHPSPVLLSGVRSVFRAFYNGDRADAAPLLALIPPSSSKK